MKRLSIDTLPTLAISVGATTPVPTGSLPAVVWSSITGGLVCFNGTYWESLAIGAVARPSAPTLSTPADGASASGTSYAVASYTHPENIPVGLQIQRANDASFTSGVEYSSVTQDSGTTRVMTASAVGVVKYWRARWVAGSQVSEWSITRGYTGMADAVNRLPTAATAATYGGVTMSASSEFSGTYAAYKACGAGEYVCNGTSTFWWRADFGSSIVMTKVIITPRAVIDGVITAWKIQGSNDGVTWSDVYTSSATLAETPNTFTFANTTGYTKWRFNATAITSPVNQGLINIEMWG